MTEQVLHLLRSALVVLRRSAAIAGPTIRRVEHRGRHLLRLAIAEVRGSDRARSARRALERGRARLLVRREGDPAAALDRIVEDARHDAGAPGRSAP